MKRKMIRVDVPGNNVTVYFDVERVLAFYAPNTDFLGVDRAPLQRGQSVYNVEYYKETDRLKITRHTCLKPSPEHEVQVDTFWCTPPRDIAAGEHVNAKYKGMEITVEPMTESLYQDTRSSKSGGYATE